MSKLTITRVQTFLTMPSGRSSARLIVAKVETSEPGLFGLGCATFTQRHRAVQAALDHHIGPFVVGKDPRHIEDLWHAMMVNGYWRNGPVLNNAIAGVDIALWDIAGKIAGVPCYQLWGGKCREGAAVYVHADGQDVAQVIENARKFLAQGHQHIRCQLGGYPGLEGASAHQPDGAPPGTYFDPSEKLRRTPALFQAVREALGDEVELLHDVHERLAPIDAVWLAKALEPYRLFYLEDLLAPEDGAWFATVRQQCATPLAMGELFDHPLEFVPLVAGRLIDFVRCHITAIGGITPAIKLAHLCEAFGVRTAWHGPGDVSPVGMAANVHLDVAMHNFGIQEWGARKPEELEMFPGMPQVRDGYVYPNDRPGLGIDFIEDLAARYPVTDDNPSWTVSRLPDGTLWRP